MTLGIVSIFAENTSREELFLTVCCFFLVLRFHWSLQESRGAAILVRAQLILVAPFFSQANKVLIRF